MLPSAADQPTQDDVSVVIIQANVFELEQQAKVNVEFTKLLKSYFKHKNSATPKEPCKNISSGNILTTTMPYGQVYFEKSSYQQVGFILILILIITPTEKP